MICLEALVGECIVIRSVIGIIKTSCYMYHLHALLFELFLSPLSLSLSLHVVYCTTQATNLKVCAVAEDLQKKLKKFRFRKEKNNAAIVSK